MSKNALSRLRALLPWVAVVLFLVAAWSVGRTVSEHGLGTILRTFESMSASRIAAAVLFAACSFLVLTLFDWLAVTTVSGRRLRYPEVALTSFTAISLGHVVGMAALSSGVIRYRFYSRLGVSAAGVARVVVFAGTTVAIGLATVAGAASVTRPGTLSRFADAPVWLVAALGWTALLSVGAYVLWTARRAGSRVRFLDYPVPPVRAALAQVLLGSTNFVLVSATLYALLGNAVEVSLFVFASFYAVANALGILSHVPGGLGVLEMVVLAVIPDVDAVAALLGFRLIYYFLPLVIGAGVYAFVELSRKQRSERGTRGSLD